MKNKVYYWNDYKDDRNNKKRSHTQLDSRKQVIAFQDRVITINIKEAQHPLKWEKQVIDKSGIMLKIMKDYKDDRSLHPLFGHSNYHWNRQFSIEMMSKITELYILFGTFKFQLTKIVQYWNDYKDDRTLHSLWRHSNSNWKRQFSTKTITKMTETNILCGGI